MTQSSNARGRATAPDQPPADHSWLGAVVGWLIGWVILGGLGFTWFWLVVALHPLGQ